MGVICSVSLFAQIDSGGGIASFGGGTNHSSIGSPFSTGGTFEGVIEILYPPLPSLNPDADTDSDGLLDSWENEHFGNLGVDSATDSDGDGTTNLMEYLAGTDPLAVSSFFRPAAHTENGILLLTVPTVAGRNYRVWGTVNLQGSWTPHETISGDGSTVEWQYNMGQTQRYFLRVEILIPQPN